MDTSFFRRGYPRPHFSRSFFALENGEWDFSFDDQDRGLSLLYQSAVPPNAQKIIVPYAYQVPASGIGDSTYHPVVWYWKTIEMPSFEDDEQVFLNFEAVDYRAEVYINGRLATVHEGGYERFSVDLAPYARQDKTMSLFVAVRIEDRDETDKPRGKQSWQKQPWGCWYLPTTGIYRDVWIEKTNRTHLVNLSLIPVRGATRADFTYEISSFERGIVLQLDASVDGKPIASLSLQPMFERGTGSIDLTTEIDGFHRLYWSPDDPRLIEVKATILRKERVLDEVQTYFGYRFFEAVGNAFWLNRNPVFLRGVLEQGYHLETGMTYESDEAIEQEVRSIKNLGFNWIRMHQKIEDARFYYHCDALGIFCTLEMPSAYTFSSRTVERLSCQWSSAVLDHLNNPSVIMYMPLNESWGVPDIDTSGPQQNFARSLFYLTKSLDPSRLIVDNDGWEHVQTDVVTLHNYDQDPSSLTHFYADMKAVLNDDHSVNNLQSRRSFAHGCRYEGQPIVLDEMAGIGFNLASKDSWGYGEAVANGDSYFKRLSGLIRAVENNRSFAGFCITQYSDVYIEMNGLTDAHRKPKIPAERIKAAVLGHEKETDIADK